MAYDKLYNFGGQQVTIGQMWAWLVSGLASWDYPNPLGYSIVPYTNGQPFNIIRYFQDVVGEVPTTETRLYFNDEGSCTSDDATFTIWATVDAGRVFFGCLPGVPTDNSITLSRQCQQRYCIYNGCDPSNITERDYLLSNVFIYENTVPNDGTLNGPNSTNVPGDRWRLLMLGWGTSIEGISPDVEYFCDSEGETRSGRYVPKYNEGSGIQGGYYPQFPVTWYKYDTNHLPSFMFEPIETWEDVPQEVGGGGGSYGYHGENDGIDDLMDIDFTDLGFTSMYAPSATDIKALARIMWTDSFLDAMEKSAVGQPMDAIISLSCVPLYLGSIVGSPENVYLGKYSTGIFMSPLTKTSIRIDCGEIRIVETWGTATDYNSTVELFIPFVGMVQVNISEVMGGSVHLYYDVNLLSGDFCAKVTCINTWMGFRRELTIYQHVGNLQTSIPVTAIDYSSYYKNRVGGAAQLIGAVASGASGVGAIGGIIGGLNQMLTPPTISRSGNLTGASGLMSLKVPKLIITKPNQYVPQPAKTYAPLKGMPSYLSCKLSELKGYNELDSVKLEGFTGTQTEYNKLITLLKEGVYYG